jgi:catalase
MSDPRLTTNAGAPAPSNDHSQSAGVRGPLLLQDHVLIEKLAAFNRERIPERVVHAKGAGAHGYFEVTHDHTAHTRAKFLNAIGKRTPLFARFSTVGGEKGSADSERDPRGFAIKFYTEEGNYDLVGNNTPVFFIRDPFKFPDLIHSHKRHPQSGLKDPVAFWDFFSHMPESLHQATILFSDRGTPASFRHMHGFGSHTFQWVNDKGEGVWVKYHFRTAEGVRNLLAEEATRLAGEDPDHATRDLFEHLAAGRTAVWNVFVQIMPLNDADTYRYDPFDVTRVWRYKDYPLLPLGRMVLDRNPDNFFAETEQVAFSPSNFVPGIEASPDKLLQGRLFAYPDTHRYRLGANFAQIPVNAPKCPFANYQRDGAMRVNANGGAKPVYEPNSFHGPVADPSAMERPLPLTGETGRTAYPTGGKADDFEQPGLLFRVLTAEEQQRLIGNIAGHMKPVPRDIQLRQLGYFLRADAAYGRGVADALGIAIADVEKAMT